MRTAPLLLIASLISLWGFAALGQTRSGDGAGAQAPRRITKYPTLKSFVEATYPADKKAAGVEAAVVLTIEISAVGLVNAVNVARSAGEDFDAAAIDAAKRFEFEPAEVDGKPAPAKLTYRYEFKITKEPEPPPSVNFEGRVLERQTATPVAGASVALEDLGVFATTDADGRFAMVGVPNGLHRVKVTAARIQVSFFEEEIASGKKSVLTYRVAGVKSPSPEETLEILVRAARPRREAAAVIISAAEARHVAGTQGDVLKVVQNLPGVSRPPLSSGQIVVWGSAPKDTRVYVDGVEIPALYHGAGLRSTINSDLVTSVELVPGAYGADYGRGLGGLVRVETRPLPKEGVHGYVGADTLDASGMVAAKLTDRLRVGAAARYSYLDSVISAVSAPAVEDFFPIPRYRDYQAKATLDLGRNEAIDAVFLGSNDDLRRAIPSPDPARVRAETTESSFHRAYLRYVRVGSNGDTVSVTPFAGYDHANVTTSFGDVPTQLDVGSWKYGLRASHRSKITRSMDLSLGVDALGASSSIRRAGTLTLPPREGDVTVFGQPPGSDYNVDEWSTNIVDLGPYVISDIRLGKFTFTPGLRFDAFLIEGSRMTPRVGLTPAIGFSRMEGAVDPRLTVRYQATPRLLVTASAGTYHQPPEPEDLSAVFGTPELALSHATHVSLGEAFKLTPTLTAEMIGFYKYLGNLPVRTRLAEPKLARALTQDGEGRSYGVQLLLRQEMTRGLFGWISYSISRSERRYLLEERYRLFDYDQPHVLAAVLSQEIGRWVFGARFRYTSGAPRTPVVGSFYDARGDQAQPVFGEQNTVRISDFYQLDVRAERTFALGKRVTLAVFLDVLNVTFHQNREEIVYSSDFKRKGYITGLPTLAILGARVEF